MLLFVATPNHEAQCVRPRERVSENRIHPEDPSHGPDEPKLPVCSVHSHSQIAPLIWHHLSRLSRYR